MAADLFTRLFTEQTQPDTRIVATDTSTRAARPQFSCRTLESASRARRHATKLPATVTQILSDCRDIGSQQTQHTHTHAATIMRTSDVDIQTHTSHASWMLESCCWLRRWFGFFQRSELCLSPSGSAHKVESVYSQTLCNTVWISTCAHIWCR